MLFFCAFGGSQRFVCQILAFYSLVNIGRFWWLRVQEHFLHLNMRIELVLF